MSDSSLGDIQHLYAASAAECIEIYANCTKRSPQNHAEAMQNYATSIYNKLHAIEIAQCAKSASRDEMLQTISLIRGMLQATASAQVHLVIIGFGADRFEKHILSPLLDTTTLQLFFQRLHVLRILISKLRANADEGATWRNEQAGLTLRTSWYDFVNAVYCRVLHSIVFRFATSYLVGVSESVAELFHEIIQTHSIIASCPNLCDYEHVVLATQNTTTTCNSFVCQHVVAPLVAMPFTRGSLRIWQRVLPIIGANQFLKLISDFGTRLRDALENSNEAHVAGDFYAALLVAARSELSHSAVSLNGFWTAHFLEPVCTMLFDASDTCRLNCVQCVLPDTIRIIGGSFSILLERAEAEQRRRSESALIVIASLHRLVRTCRVDNASEFVLVLGESDGTDERAIAVERYVHSDTLRQSIVHENESVRLEAFCFVCQSVRSTERITATEWQLVLTFLRGNLRTANPSHRRRVTYNLKVLLGRMRLTVADETVSDYVNAFSALIHTVRSLVLVRRPEEAGQDAAEAFELRSLDESTYQRERAFIDALRELQSAFPRADFDAQLCPTPEKPSEPNVKRSRKLREQKTRGNVEALRTFYSESNRAMLYSTTNAEWLLGLLTRSFFTDVQQDAAAILTNMLIDSLSHSQLVELTELAFRLSNQAPQKHFLAGSALMGVVLAALQPSNTGSVKSTIAPDVVSEQLSNLLGRLCKSLEDSFDEIELGGEIGSMAVERTALGVLVTMKEVCLRADCALDTDKVCALLRRTVAHVTNLLKLFGSEQRDVSMGTEENNAEWDAQESANPSFADLSIALSRLALADADGNPEAVKLSAKYQFVCSLIWHQLRYSLELLVALASALLSRSNVSLTCTRELIEATNGAFVRVLLECRHIGVIASVGVAYRCFCETLLRFDVSSVIETTFVDVLACVANDSLRFNITRRSAGLPQLVRAIWLAFRTRRTSRSTFLQRAVRMWITSLTSCCQRILDCSTPMPTANDSVERDSSATHLLNVLHFVLRNEACLVEAFEAHFDELLALAARLFTAPRHCAVQWSVLNSAQQLLAVVACRMLGDKRVLQLNDAAESCSALTAQHFFAHFPLAIQTLIQLLQTGASRSVIPALLILAKMNGAKCAVRVDAEAKQLLAIVLSTQTVRHASFLVRSLWSKAIFTLLPADRVWNYLMKAVEKCSERDCFVSSNAKHSVLMLALEYTRRYASASSQTRNNALLQSAVSIMKDTNCEVNRAICLDISALLPRNTSHSELHDVVLGVIEAIGTSKVHGLLYISMLRYLLISASMHPPNLQRVSSTFCALFEDVIRREDVFLAEKLTALVSNCASRHQHRGLMLILEGCFSALAVQINSVASKRFLFSLFGFLLTVLQRMQRIDGDGYVPPACGGFYTALVDCVLRPRPVLFLPHVSRGLLLATHCLLEAGHNAKSDIDVAPVDCWLSVAERLLNDVMLGIGIGYDEQLEAFFGHFAESCCIASRLCRSSISHTRRIVELLFRLVTSRFFNDTAKHFAARSIAFLSNCDGHAHHYPDALRYLVSHVELFCHTKRDTLRFLVDSLSTVCASIRQEADARYAAEADCDPVLYEHEQVAANDDVLFLLELVVAQLKVTLLAGTTSEESADCITQLRELRLSLNNGSSGWNREYQAVLSSLFDSLMVY